MTHAAASAVQGVVEPGADAAGKEDIIQWPVAYRTPPLLMISELLICPTHQQKEGPNHGKVETVSASLWRWGAQKIQRD